ncbi:hypothetical protein DFJ74DRAFT_765280 [Hyaloraphidium curvatum]|nr:hypothetical protein DFJ74DRAFT_765280 [Hyaloraphidium curvatum]
MPDHKPIDADGRKSPALQHTLSDLPAAGVRKSELLSESLLRHLAVSGAVPFLFGLALQKGRVFEPKVIQDIFLLKDFTMMSMFLSAVSTSQLLFALLSSVPADSANPTFRWLGEHFRKTKSTYQTNRASQRGTISAAAGAAVLGAGMLLAGACPGTVYAAAGSGVKGSWTVLAGGLTGLTLFTAAERTVLPGLFEKGRVAEPAFEKAVWGEGTSYAKAAFISSAVLGAAALAFNLFLPNSHPYPEIPIRSLLDALRAPAWNPIVSGAVIGTLQIPMVILGDTFLGTTSQMVSLLAPFQPVFAALGLADSKSEVTRWAPFLSSKTLFGGLGFLSMLTAGAYVSSRLGGVNGSVRGLLEGGVGGPSILLFKDHPIVQPLLAGMMIWFGSRTALGCTSGHGISGFSLLSVNSVVAVAAMFGTGILTAQVLNAVL